MLVHISQSITEYMNLCADIKIKISIRPMKVWYSERTRTKTICACCAQLHRQLEVDEAGHNLILPRLHFKVLNPRHNKDYIYKYNVCESSVDTFESHTARESVHCVVFLLVYLWEESVGPMETSVCSKSYSRPNKPTHEWSCSLT